MRDHFSQLLMTAMSTIVLFLLRATCGKEIMFVKQFSSSAARWPPIHLLDKSFELGAPLQNALRPGPTQNERALVVVRHIS